MDTRNSCEPSELEGGLLPEEFNDFHPGSVLLVCHNGKMMDRVRIQGLDSYMDDFGYSCGDIIEAISLERFPGKTVFFADSGGAWRRLFRIGEETFRIRRSLPTLELFPTSHT